MKRMECINPFRKDVLACSRHIYEIIINKKISFEKYFNEHLGKILICSIVAVVAITTFTDIYDRRDVGEKLIGFGGYQNYKVIKIDLPTEGDIVLLRKMPFREYEIKNLSNGNVMITGNFYYEIRPQTKFAPNLYHTDKYGNTPEKNNYWGATRYGTVLLSMNEPQHL